MTTKQGIFGDAELRRLRKVTPATTVVLGSGTSTGTNTGDQVVFNTIAVAGQSDVVADTTTDTLTLTAGSGIAITTDASTDSITFSVDSSGATPGSILRYNGTAWKPGDPSVSSAGPAVVMYNSSPTLVAASANNSFPILTLSKTPIVTTEQTITGTGDNSSTPIPFAAWLYDTAINRTTIDAGQWIFDTFAATNTSGGVTSIYRATYVVVDAIVGTITTTGSGTSRTATASAGTPFSTSAITASSTATTASWLRTTTGLYQITSRTSDTVVTIAVPAAYSNQSAVAFGTWKVVAGGTVGDINSTGTDYALYSSIYASAAISITAATKLGSLMFVLSTTSKTVTVTYDGTTRGSHFDTPFSTQHNEVSGLQGGSADQYYHLTASEYTGVGTGDFVRNTGVISRPLTGYTAALGTVSATDTILQAIQKVDGNAAAFAQSARLISTGETYQVVSGRQMLFTLDIINDGDLINDGDIIEVS